MLAIPRPHPPRTSLPCCTVYTWQTAGSSLDTCHMGAATVSGKPAAMHKMGGTDVHNWGITFQAEKSQGATSAAQCYSCETKQSPNSYLSENMYISTRKWGAWSDDSGSFRRKPRRDWRTRGLSTSAWHFHNENIIMGLCGLKKSQPATEDTRVLTHQEL